MPSMTQHQKYTKHCPCPCCDSSDSHEVLLEARLPPIARYSCPKCRLRFAQQLSLETHQRESLHAYCHICNIFNATIRLHALHMKSHAPVPATTLCPTTHILCCDCEREFKDERAFADHLLHTNDHAAWVHESRSDTNLNNKKTKQQQEKGDKRPKCKRCRRTFKDQVALGQHLASVRHKPLSNIKCVAEAECKKRFNCPSAQLHHLESGRCVSGMTKSKLTAAIAANDKGRIITSRGVTEQWLVEDTVSASSTSPIQSPILTPTSTEFLGSYPPSAIRTPTSTLSTSTNFQFMHSALQQHLSSGIHAQLSISLLAPDEISFHCPSALMSEETKKNAVRQFSTVSGLAQHLESGACDGGKGTLNRVVEYVQDEVKAMGYGRVKLLR